MNPCRNRGCRSSLTDLHGVSEAQVELGELYAEGKPTVSDTQTAKKWFVLAAEQGNAEAQRWLERIEKRS